MTLKALLKEKGISILEMSRQARIAPSDLSQALNGKKPFFPGWRRRVSEALGMPEESLFPEFVDKEG